MTTYTVGARCPATLLCASFEVNHDHNVNDGLRQNFSDVSPMFLQTERLRLFSCPLVACFIIISMRSIQDCVFCNHQPRLGLLASVDLVILWVFPPHHDLAMVA